MASDGVARQLERLEEELQTPDELERNLKDLEEPEDEEESPVLISIASLLGLALELERRGLDLFAWILRSLVERFSEDSQRIGGDFPAPKPLVADTVSACEPCFLFIEAAWLRQFLASTAGPFVAANDGNSQGSAAPSTPFRQGDWNGCRPNQRWAMGFPFGVK